MHPTEYNLALIEAMLEEIRAYLVSPELYWPLDRKAPRGSPAFPRLTLGGLALAFDELAAQEPQMDPAQSASLTRLRLRFEQARRQHGAAIATKAARELHSRLDLWQAYLADLVDQPAAGEDYPHQVSNRVMAWRLIELAAAQPDLTQLRTRMGGLDDRLRGLFARGTFIWDPRLQAVYPPDSFWFLYGRPRSRS